jgi:hypothetical protein
MTIERINLEPDTDLVSVLEHVHEDGQPRVIDRDGEPFAVVVNPEHFGVSIMPASSRHKARLLAMAGVWSDLDPEELIGRVYEARNAAPPSSVPSA